MLWIFYGMTGAAVFILRRKHPDADRPYRVWGYPIIPSLFLLVTFGWAGYTALSWPLPVRQFPLLIAIPGVLLSLPVVLRDVVHLVQAQKLAGSWAATMEQASKDAWLRPALTFFGYVIGLIVLTLLIGQKLAIPIFVGVYLLRWGGYSRRVALAYALGAWAVLVFFYDRIMSLLFHTSYLELWLQGIMPSGVPDWLIF